MKEHKSISRSKTFLIVFNCFLALAIVVSGMMIVIDRSRIKNGVAYTGGSPAGETATAQDSTSKLTGTRSARLMCAGDNLIHRSIYKQAKARSQDGGYDFSYDYAMIKDIIGKADIAFLNQETVIDPEKEPSSYPLFNSPPELLDTMIDVGFDVYNQATNHVMDKQLSGALNDLKLFHSKKDIILTGLYENNEEMLKPQTKDVNGITFSFVGFTQYLNGLTVPSDSDLGLVYLTDKRKTQDELYATMKKMIETARAASDVVCVSMHWQEENITKPNDSEKEIVDKLLEYGADIIIGTGPHALQPIEYMQNGDGEQALVIWSLGNFISCQDSMVNLLGGIADVKVSKDLATGKTKVDSGKLIPTITQYGGSYSNVHVVPLSDYTEELARAHSCSGRNSSFTLTGIKKFYEDMYGDKLELKAE